jgi:hypothetical protein
MERFGLGVVTIPVTLAMPTGSTVKVHQFRYQALNGMMLIWVDTLLRPEKLMERFGLGDVIILDN